MGLEPGTASSVVDDSELKLHVTNVYSLRCELDGYLSGKSETSLYLSVLPYLTRAPDKKG